MDRKTFRDILRKYLQGRAMPGEEKIIDSWYTGLRKKKGAPLNKDNESSISERQWSVIHAHVRKREAGSVRSWASIGIAASVIIAVAALLYLNWGIHTTGDGLALQEDVSVKWKLINNEGKTSRVITLPDQTVITLEPQSRLRFSLAFDELERVVYLEGEAFFEVSPSVERPFLVHTSNLTTRVLGTSFRVKAFQQEKEVIVAVKTGKVSVYTSDEHEKWKAASKEVVLTPNQKVVYDRAGKNLSRMIVESPQAIIPAEEIKKLRFEAAPIREIFQAVEKVYGLQVEFDETKFRDCTLTTAISDGDIFNTLHIVCNAIGAGYEVKEDRIVINGKGCDYQ